METKKETKKVLKGIARSKGRAAGEALVSQVRMGWGFNHISNEAGVVMVPGSNIYGQSVKDKIVIYPTVLGSTVGSVSLYFKCKVSKVGPAGFICQKVHYIDMAGAIASDIPSVDDLEADPLQEIQTGDWVEIQADEVGKEALVTITRRG